MGQGITTYVSAHLRVQLHEERHGHLYPAASARPYQHDDHRALPAFTRRRLRPGRPGARSHAVTVAGAELPGLLYDDTQPITMNTFTSLVRVAGRACLQRKEVR